jgi:hypothetical protein
MLDLTGHMIIWGGIFANGDGSTRLMKVVSELNARSPHRLDMSRSSLGVVFQGLPARGRSVTFPV